MSDASCIQVPIKLLVTRRDEPGSDVESYSLPEYGPAPKHGWDNAIDVAEFKQRCQDASGFPLANPMGMRCIFDLAYRARDLGISKPTADRLIHRFCSTPISKASISLETHRAYKVSMSVPGTLSRAARANANAVAALISADDDNPWETATDDQAPRGVWPTPLTYQ